MSVNLSVTARNNRLDSIETTLGTAALLRIYSGSKPTACADAPTGTLLAEMSLPSDYMNAAGSGQKTKLGTWSDASANADGTAGYFRLYDSGGTNCHLQGTVTATGNGGDLTLDNINIATGQVVTITSFTLTDGNA